MSTRTTCAIVPVKALGGAKRRLAPVLPAAARRRLVLTMLEDVLAAAAPASSGIDRVLVVTPDASVAAWRARRAAHVVPRADRCRSELNAAVRAAASPMRCARGAARPWCCRPTCPSPRRTSCASADPIARRPSPA